ncbi:peptidase domain protein [Hyphomonas neptunium ATCC 15444]|uniref:Peptidase domain protein n=2 Tax=Hyphomonas TaxID=85 RepID=Q0BZN8_HYPNA|nr:MULTISPECIES: PepSY domain-containing protein [Hyphomonas]ABI76069.1 peptidase domain protein [Hyphomonas neptunium ATCC 15444]KCZ86754.1 peptidase domain-containing protein [Hyphomonas hirschiana VP5]
MLSGFIPKWLLAGCLLLAAVAPAFADWDEDGDDDDGDRGDEEIVWDARKRGEILPLEIILGSVLQQYPGELLKLELDEDDGYLIYEIEVLTRRGTVLEMDVDARTGRILDIEEDD